MLSDFELEGEPQKGGMMESKKMDESFFQFLLVQFVTICLFPRH